MKKATTVPVITYEQAQEAMTALSNATNSLQSVEAKLNKQILKLREKQEARIEELKSSIAENEALLTTYALAEKSNWPKKRLELTAGILLYRTSPPAVVLPDGKEEKDIIKILLKKFPDFVKETFTIDKKTVLDYHAGPEGQKMLKATGITVKQEEKLSIKLASENLQPV